MSRDRRRALRLGLTELVGLPALALALAVGCAPTAAPSSTGPLPPGAREVSVGTARDQLAPAPPPSSTDSPPSVPASLPSRATGSVVVVARDISPRDPAWYQINVMLVDNTSRILAPDGNFRVRLAPSVGPDGRPIELDGIRWDRFDPVVIGVPPGWTVQGVRNKKFPTEWLDCKAMLLLPMAEMAQVLPAGCRLAKLTLEFLPRDARQSFTPESFEWVVPDAIADRGVHPPEQPARKLELRLATEAEAAVGEPVPPGSVGVVLELLNQDGAATQPSGSLRVSVAAATAEATAGTPAPPAAEAFRPIGGVPLPTLLGRRVQPVGEFAKSARFQYLARLTLETNRLRAALRDGPTGPLPAVSGAWLRVEFVPVDTGQPALAQTLAISLDAARR